MGRGKQHFVSLLFTGKRTEDKTYCWEVDEQLQTTEIALVKIGVHILCLSLRISSYFLRIPPQKVHDRAFSTSPAPRASFGQMVKVVDWFSSHLWCKNNATLNLPLRRKISDAEPSQFDFRAQLLEIVPI